MGREFRKKFEERIVGHTFVFSVIDIHLEKIVYDFLPFKIFCDSFFRVRGIRNTGKCDVCSRFLVDDSDISSKIDQGFLLSKNSLQHLPICELMERVNSRPIVLNLHYLVGEYAGNGKWNENFGEILFEIANNPLSVYIFYLQIYLRMFFNLLKPVTEKVVENYLAEHCPSKLTVSKIRRRINNTLISCYSKTVRKLLRYFNNVLSNKTFEWIFLTYRSGIKYNNETFKILNLK